MESTKQSTPGMMSPEEYLTAPVIASLPTLRHLPRSTSWKSFIIVPLMLAFLHRYIFTFVRIEAEASVELRSIFSFFVEPDPMLTFEEWTGLFSSVGVLAVIIPLLKWWINDRPMPEKENGNVHLGKEIEQFSQLASDWEAYLGKDKDWSKSTYQRHIASFEEIARKVPRPMVRGSEVPKYVFSFLAFAILAPLFDLIIYTLPELRESGWGKIVISVLLVALICVVIIVSLEYFERRYFSRIRFYQALNSLQDELMLAKKAKWEYCDYVAVTAEGVWDVSFEHRFYRRIVIGSRGWTKKYTVGWAIVFVLIFSLMVYLWYFFSVKFTGLFLFEIIGVTILSVVLAQLFVWKARKEIAFYGLREPSIVRIYLAFVLLSAFAVSFFCLLSVGVFNAFISVSLPFVLAFTVLLGSFVLFVFCTLVPFLPPSGELESEYQKGVFFSFDYFVANLNNVNLKAN